MMLEDCESSASPVGCKASHFRPFAEFDGASYRRRYEVLIEKLVRDRLYDGACLLTSGQSAGEGGAFAEPHAELTFERFVRPLIGHVSALCRG